MSTHCPIRRELDEWYCPRCALRWADGEERPECRAAVTEPLGRVEVFADVTYPCALRLGVSVERVPAPWSSIPRQPDLLRPWLLVGGERVAVLRAPMPDTARGRLELWDWVSRLFPGLR